MGELKKEKKDEGKGEEEEQDGFSEHSPGQQRAPPSSASSLPKECSQVELEMRVLEALEIYPPSKLQGWMFKFYHGIRVKPRVCGGRKTFIPGRTLTHVVNVTELMFIPAAREGIHRHFILYGMMEYLQKRFGRNFSADEILQLLDRFFNLEMLEPDAEENEILNQEEGFSLPQSCFTKEE